MDEAIIKYYRQLLKEDFPNSGALENPSIFVEAIGEHMINCGNTGNYMQLYLRVVELRIEDIKYLCSCEPVANVAVEVLCTLVKGKTLDEASSLTEGSFYQILESGDEDLSRKVRGLLALLHEGIGRDHNNPSDENEPVVKDGDEQGGKLSWDGTLST
jgi:NifU-like protein involved in Fe-S cluster formation